MPSDDDEAPALSLLLIALAQPSVGTASARDFARPCREGEERDEALWAVRDSGGRCFLMSKEPVLGTAGGHYWAPKIEDNAPLGTFTIS